MEGINLRDNGGTRSGFERRQYTFDIHIPERRSGKDRRSGEDRRQTLVTRKNPAVERREAFSQPQTAIIEASE